MQDGRNDMPTITPSSEWVSVEDRLPDTAGEFLVVYHPCYGDKVTSEIRVGIDSFRGKIAWAKRKYQRGSKSVRKCIAYGGLHSSKADWAKYWSACGLYSTPVTKQMVSDVAKRKFARIRNANAINVCSEWEIGHVEILMDSEVRKNEP